MEKNIDKALIINGSPHRNGNTSYITQKIKEKLNCQVEEIYPYFDKISPCIDCHYCQKNEGCHLKDDMEKIYRDDYDLLILASPVHFYNLTPPMLSVVTRLNMIWCNKHFLGLEKTFHEKEGILVLTGGGNGEPKYAIEMAMKVFKYLNAKFDINTDYIYSLKTDTIPAFEDKNLSAMIKKRIK